MSSRFPRPTAFLIAASDHGTMIVSRLDYAVGDDGYPYGVGYQILQYGSYETTEVADFLYFLEKRRTHFGDGVVALDCGANIGVHTVEWAKAMTGWGRVIAIEAQERIFYALAGNIAINNCLNARAIHAAVAAHNGHLRVPQPDYLQPANLGGLELIETDTTEFIGQPIDYTDDATVELIAIAIDGMGLKRLDFLKIDVEGMEGDVLDGAKATIAACRPVIVAEHIKTGWKPLKRRLATLGYETFLTRMNLIAIHRDDPVLAEIKPSKPVRTKSARPTKARESETLATKAPAKKPPAKKPPAKKPPAKKPPAKKPPAKKPGAKTIGATKTRRPKT